MTRLCLLSALCLGACSLAQDVSDFQTDQPCDVDLTLRRFVPHSNEVRELNFLQDDRELFELRIVRTESGSTEREVSAVFDPLPSPDVRIFLPGAVEAAEDIGDRPSVLELIADRERDGIDQPSRDHTYQFDPACEMEGATFEHTTDFVGLDEEVLLQPSNLVIRPLPGAIALGWFDVAIEVKAFVEDETGDQLIARAFYRRERYAEPPAAGTDNGELVLTGVLRDDEDTTVIVMADRNGDGIFDAGDDLAANFTVPTAAPRCPALRGDACTEDTDPERETFVIPVSLTDMFEGDTRGLQPWWNEVDPL